MPDDHPSRGPCRHGDRDGFPSSPGPQAWHVEGARAYLSMKSEALLQPQLWEPLAEAQVCPAEASGPGRAHTPAATS